MRRGCEMFMVVIAQCSDQWKLKSGGLCQQLQAFHFLLHHKIVDISLLCIGVLACQFLGHLLYTYRNFCPCWTYCANTATWIIDRNITQWDTADELSVHLDSCIEPTGWVLIFFAKKNAPMLEWRFIGATPFHNALYSTQDERAQDERAYILIVSEIMCTHDNLAKNYQLINKLGSSYKTTLQRLVKAAFKCVEGPRSKELKSKSTVVGLWDGLTHHT